MWYRARAVGLIQRFSTANAVSLSAPGQGIEASWVLDDVDSPHSLALIAGPARLGGTERPIAALVGETRIAGSRLHKVILMPPGMAKPALRA